MTAQTVETPTNPDNATAAAAYVVGTIVEVDPSTLLLDKNIREAKPDAGLIKSIKAVGVIEIINVVLTEDGTLRVRQGHRRTLGAIEAGRTVRVYIAAKENDATDEKMHAQAEVERIVSQRDENTHRTGLTTAEDAATVGQLAAFGLTATQIARKARISKTDVEHALAVVASPVATETAERHVDLTLEQAATLAEFEDDTEAVETLVGAAAEGMFEHVAQQIRDAREDARERQALVDALTEAGVTVIDEPPYSGPIKALSRLVATAYDPKQVERRETLSVEGHAKCPGHVVWTEREWIMVDKKTGEPKGPEAEGLTWDERRARYEQVQRWGAVYGCADYAAHGHHDRDATGAATQKPKAADMSEPERAKANASRKLVVDNNKAWASATTVRQAWIKAWASRGNAPKGSAAFLAVALCRDSYLLSEQGAADLLTEWLPAKGKAQKDRTRYTHRSTAADEAPKATEARALVLALVQTLACYEAGLNKGSWRQDGTDNAAGRYLRFLDTIDYPLSEVEKFTISKKTA